MGDRLTKTKVEDRSVGTSVMDGLPVEMLQLIFTYVPSRDLVVNCSRVCKQWHELVNDDVFWRRQCDSAGIAYPTEWTKHGDNQLLSFQRLYFYRPFGRNLVKNWNAADGFKHWTITENGGDEFMVQPDKCPGCEHVSSIGIAGCESCWATSFSWCFKHQLIDLFAEGFTKTMLEQLPLSIEVSEWVACRFDCGAQYELEMELWSKDQKILEQHKIEKDWVQWDNNGWQQVTHTFASLPKNVCYVYIKHGGKDSQFWKGHYGPKITATSVMVKCS